MIVSHKHRFIFLKTGKTAGTSIEIFLSRFLDKGDIATPIKPEHEPARAPAGPRNYLRDFGPAGWKRYGSLLPGAAGRFAGRPNHDVDFYPHIPASRARTLLGEAVWTGYFKFAFDRNPWDKQVSYYYWATRKDEKRPEFRSFTVADRRRIRAWPIYATNDVVAVDFVGRFENLDADLAVALGRVGIDAPVELGRTVTTDRPDRDYRGHYDAATRDVIARASAREIRLLGYSF